MSAPRVLKFPITPSGNHIAEGMVCTPIACGYQNGEVVVWAEVDEWRYHIAGLSYAPDGCRIIAVATGQDRPPSAFKYLGTVQGVEGDPVFHLYYISLRKRVA